ncbi:hypothetical protein FOCG_17944 [Fusarium oxysporum f. sp. radicis-lycopersici 26381]|uniref:Uncharacterized protein n=1 Tax=Fusarium oxysporum f. sp. conglutinans race 2 54008 TaxID=1089457 RepID=X0H327_FUSOX|nr:hypothetical protein FOCG_17944 [Fusarium oxysporum f. sp. radicis-lycopersici 26381]EXL66435.1 hypothetical protein FOPG_17386 [Fusarium oxysporum f. sp. conglutinans race 2 54008]
MWFRPMPLILIKDEELTYHGKILSVSDTLRLRIQTGH